MPEYTNSSMVSFTSISPNCNIGRVSSYNPSGRITKITPHYSAGNCSIETLGNIFKPESRQASSTYGIGSDGRVGQYVNEKDRPWTSSSPSNDYNAVTIEVANLNNTTGEITNEAWHSLIALCTDICRRNGIPSMDFTGNANGNLTMHCMFASTACPGPWLKAHMSALADAVNANLHPGVTPAPAPVPVSGTYKVVTNLAGYVTADNALSGSNRVNTVHPGTYYVFNVVSGAVNVTTKQGVPGSWINGALNKGATPAPAPAPTPASHMSLTAIANDVIRGNWGNGQDRANKLHAAGYIDTAVQAAVNAIYNKQAVPNILYLINGISPAPVTSRKSNTQVAHEIILGEWGVGQARADNLAKAGYNYDDIQKIVNQMMR